MYSGRYPYSVGDNLIATFNYTGIAIPQYIIALIAIYFFAFQLGWFPYKGSATPGLDSGTIEYWIDRIHHVILSAIILGLFSIAYFSKFLLTDIFYNIFIVYINSD